MRGGFKGGGSLWVTGGGVGESTKAKFLPDGYEYKKGADGKLELWKGTELIEKQDETGAWIKSSVSTGVGSFHLGEIHSIGSANENVVFTNDLSDISWFPAWQGISKDGGTVYHPTTQAFGALTSVEPSGAVSSGNVDYVDNITAATDITYFKLEFVPHEDYSGLLVWSANRTPSNKEVASFAIPVDLVAGNRFTLNFEYPLFVKSGQTFTVSLKKGYDGDYLRVRNGATLPTTPYRRVYTRTTQNWPLMPQAGDVKNSYATSDHNGWVLLNGRAKSTLTATQQTQATALGFGANLPDARNRLLIGAGSSYTLNSTGGSTTIDRSALPNATLSLSGTTGNSGSASGTTGTSPSVSATTGTRFDAGKVPQWTSSDNNWGLYQCYVDSVPPLGATFPTGRTLYLTGRSSGESLDSQSLQHSHSVVLPEHAHSFTLPTHSHSFSGNTASINGNVTQTAHLPPYLALNTFIYLGA